MTRNARRMRKYLLLVACIALVAGLAIGGTIAWLTETSGTVTNKFEPQNISVDLDESVDGEFDIVPGTTETKDPKVTVSADINSYVFVKVTETADFTVNETTYSFDDFVTYSVVTGTTNNSVDGTYWTKLSVTGLQSNEKVYYCVVKAGASGVELPVIANNTVSYSENITKDMMDDLDAAIVAKNVPETGLELTFQSYIIQQANGNNTTFTALEAWNKVSGN